MLEIIIGVLAYVLSWRAWFCISLALAHGLRHRSFVDSSPPRLDVFIVTGIVGLAAGLVWESRAS